MFYEGRNPKAGLELLDKGIARNPNEYVQPCRVLLLHEFKR